ncbi:class IIb bacteriocin, lactobin A/cerein 7B family [Proteiniphilum sp.]|uniref:class IIb bacteriocin, lactobin A/cerein 7B family n=1 Tax=Proteiniphilum sp. TaxID=1926877 RepID=UPI0026B865F6|nr:class IIb bacteriocin, lactobin A/cerein 7B family [Proteiniphilum sp.]MEA5127951.1 class IIb bacteriocin, lactobin A/cerein 7B family [Proteiniphilum sp.]
MKNLEFMELNAQELEEVNGGIIGWVIATLVTYVVMDVVMNPKSAWAEIEAGYNSY